MIIIFILFRKIRTVIIVLLVFLPIYYTPPSGAAVTDIIVYPSVPVALWASF